MTNQKHTVATDALDTLGTFPIPDNSGRDAIHLAVEPVVAAHRLRAGERIKIEDGKAASADDDAIGIVDPFVDGWVRPGQRFWLVVLPRTITSLRHVWSHPLFAEEPASAYHADADNHYVDPTAAAREWIEKFAASIPLAYDIVMDGAREYVADRKRGGYGEYLCFGGLLEGESVPDSFWPHYEIVTGEKVENDHRGSFFTCSC